MSNLVVVAIPEEMDRVWKLSSEQVPHLTLLFLGEADNNPHVQDIVQFVEHAVTVSEHGPFYLDIDHRGTLGPDEADVLFFSKRSWNLKWIQNFRAQLLQDSNIKTAYDSTTQYDEWQPHLTMGYPPTPAKEMGENDHPLYSVCFDRIAVWDTDYAGPEFRLEWPERELDGPLAVAYADQQKAALVHYGSKEEYIKHVGGTQSVLDDPDIAATIKAKLQSILDDVTGDADGDINLFGDPVIQTKIRSVLSDFYRDPNVDNAVVYSALGDVIQHHGVKGMKWGVRKDRGTGGTSGGGKGEFVKKAFKGSLRLTDDVLFEMSKDSEGVRDEIITRAGDKLKADLPGIKAKHGDYGKLRNRAKKPFSQEARAYRKDVKSTYLKHLESSANELTNFQGNRHYTLKEKGKPNTAKYYWSVSTEAAGARHAATVSTTPTLDLQPIFDEEGYIIDVKPMQSQSPAAHGAIFVDGLMHASALDSPDAAVSHHGVKGMKWGVRKDVAGGAGSGTSAFGGGRVGGSQAGLSLHRDPPKPVAPHAESKVPHGNRRKTQVDVNGGENHPATKDALKVAEAQAKLKKSGPKALTNQELRDVATRVQLEQQAMHATRHGSNKFVRETLTNQGKQVVNQLIRSKIDKAVRK